MKKVDFRKELKMFYSASPKSPALVEVPEMSFLMIDGKGAPDTSQAYTDAVEALFGLSYTLKFMVRKGDIRIDYPVMPLEGLWWVDDGVDFTTADRRQWRWTAMIMQPDFITPEMVEEAAAQLKARKNPAALEAVRFERFAEGKAAQILHIGPYSQEAPTIEKLHAFIDEKGVRRRGRHHEIYLGDPRRTAPDKLRTIIRQPVE